MPVTLKEIAETLQVSKGLVSGVLNGNPAVRVSTKNRDRVLAAARDLGYRPNAIAKALTSGSSKVVSVWTSNPFSSGYVEILRSLHEIAREDGYQLMVSETSSHFGYQAHGTTHWNWPVDGILAIDSTDRARQHVSTGSNLPIVCFGASEPASTDYVVVDLASAVEEALGHLTSIGRNKIAFLTPDVTQFRDDRATVYHSFLSNIGLPCELISTSSWNDRMEAFEAVLLRFREPDPPDALFCFSDDLAIGAYRALQQLDLRIPGDVSIVGCGDIEDGAFHAPALCTINSRPHEMTRIAWDLLRRRINQPNEPAQALSLPAFYVRRDSVGPKLEKTS